MYVLIVSMHRFSRVFVMYEQVELTEALAVVKKPRTGDIVYCFKRPRWTPIVEPPTKKSRVEDPADTGNSNDLSKLHSHNRFA